jgi:hypothetical protein
MEVTMVSNLKIMQLSLVLLLNISMYSHADPDPELEVSNIKQEDNNTCWAACCRMLNLAYNNNTTTEQYWLDRGTNGQKVGNSITGTLTSVDKLLGTYANITTTAGSGVRTFIEIKTQIDAGRPVVIRRTWTWGGHFMIITGYMNDADNTVILQDPWPKNPTDNVGQRITKSYSLLVSEDILNNWTHTCRLLSNPVNPIPLPIGGSGDNVTILTGTFDVTPSTSSLTYSAGIGGHYPNSWEWKLVFPHSYGDCVVASGTAPGSSTNPMSTWNISNFALPTGYQWIYNYDGKIPGWVEVTVVNSYTTVKDQKGVLFVPSNLYPGTVLYENNTITNAQPDIKAHELITAQNNQFVAGTNISFKSGEKIEISNGTTIQNGSIANFIVDPTLR